MNWIEVHIDTCPGELDDLCARLESQGITGLVIDDEADFKNFLENNHQYWDYVDDDLLQEKKFRWFKIGNKYRISKNSFDEWLDQQIEE